jgi:SAM-dependent methyltransferase
LQRQTPEWYDRLATLQAGYYYPWRSTIAEGNGEAAYLDIVERHLRPNADVLDCACGHGQIALDLAPRCRTILGFDRTASWIDLAQSAARERGIANATFVCHDSSPAANGGTGRIPAGDASFDLLLCSKGPFHWIEDARRVARPGATLLMIVPDSVPYPTWHESLPELLRWQDVLDPNWPRPSVERRLTTGKLTLHSWWSSDVPESFPDPEQLYVWLTWGNLAEEVPSFDEVRPVLERIFADYAGVDGLEIRHKRYLWKALVPR